MDVDDSFHLTRGDDGADPLWHTHLASDRFRSDPGGFFRRNDLGGGQDLPYRHLDVWQETHLQGNLQMAKILKTICEIEQKAVILQARF